jgi:hypothetical protein
MSEEREREQGAQVTPEGSLEKRGPSAEAAAGASDERALAEHAEEAPDEDLDDVDLREIMRQALERPPKGSPPNILGGVQRKLRTRSRGKFYGDGWSTARTPRSTYLVTSLFMLALIAFVFLVLIPWGGGALP